MPNVIVLYIIWVLLTVGFAIWCYSFWKMFIKSEPQKQNISRLQSLKEDFSKENIKNYFGNTFKLICYLTVICVILCAGYYFKNSLIGSLEFWRSIVGILMIGGFAYLVYYFAKLCKRDKQERKVLQAEPQSCAENIRKPLENFIETLKGLFYLIGFLICVAGGLYILYHIIKFLIGVYNFFIRYAN
jgi:hypothetical protein